MMDYDLPKSWLLTTLDNIGEILSGGTPSTSVQEYSSMATDQPESSA